MSKADKEIIGFRQKRAFESFEEAKMLTQINSWSGVVNRLSYACFYMVNALLLTKGLVSKTHSGTKTFFFKEFIKTGTVERRWAEHYQRLFNLRTKGDYEDLVTFSEEEIKPLLPQTGAFLNEIENILDSNN